MSVLNVAGDILALSGAGFVAIAGLGLLTLPDAYSRMSAVTKAATLGILLVLGGVLLRQPSWQAAITVALAAGLQLLTAPVGAFALGRAAYRAGTPLHPRTHYDHLKDRHGGS